MAASAEGNSEAALLLFEQAAAASPDSGVPHFLMGAEYASLGDLDKAEAGFANAILLSPALVIARYQLGLLQFSSARVAMALITWQPLLELEDDSPLPFLVQGFSALAQDHFNEARLLFEAGIARNLDNPPLSEDIQKVLLEIGLQTRIPDAEAGSPSSNQAEMQDHDGSSHILLSNYQQQGLPH